MRYILNFYDGAKKVIDNVSSVSLKNTTYIILHVGKSPMYFAKDIVESFYPEKLEPSPYTQPKLSQKEHNNKVINLYGLRK